MAKQATALSWLGGIGAGVTNALAGFGRFWLFATYAASFIPLELGGIRGWRRLLPQCLAIGTRSVPVVMLTGMFVGMVLVVQGYWQFDAAGTPTGSEPWSTFRSFRTGTVLAGVLAGRVGGR